MLDRIISQLPSLKVVRARDVRWLRKGTTSRALEAGVQGDMWEWSRRLARSKISFVDADWKEREVN
jgi:hypothetical protein